MKPDQALRQLTTSLKEHNLNEWSAGLDSAVKRFGICNLTNKHISLSRPLCELNSDEEVTDTILHEIAHALAFERHGENCRHDKRWKKICVEIGARPEACFDDKIVQPEAPWLLVHKTTNEVFSSYYKRPNRNWSQAWIRGRKEDTLGQLVIRSRKQVPKTTPSTTSDPTNTSKPKESPTAKEQTSNNTIEPIVSFTPKTVLQVQTDLVAMVKNYAKQHNLDLSGAKCRYNTLSCDFTLSLSVPSGLEADEEERISFAALAPIFDLTAKDYKRMFRVDGRKYYLVALKPKNRKYPIIAANESGKRYKFSLDIIDDLI